MQNNSENVIKILDQRYNSIQNIKDDSYFVSNLFDYINYVIENPILESIIKDLERKMADDYKIYYQLRPKVKKELEASKEKIYKIIDKFKLKNEKINELLRRTEQWGDDESTLNFDLLTIYENIPEEYKKDFLKQHTNPNYILSKSLELLHKEKDKIEHLKGVEIWNCWYWFKFAPKISRLTYSEIMSSGDVGVDITEEEMDYFINILHLREEVKAERHNDLIKRQLLLECKNCFMRLHNYFIKELSNESNPENKIKEIYIYKSDYYYKLIVVGENRNKLIEPTSAHNSKSWIEKLYKVAETGCCEHSSGITAINNNSGLDIYAKGYFTLTKILAKEENIMKPAENIKIIKIRNQEEFNKKRNRFIPI